MLGPEFSQSELRFSESRAWAGSPFLVSNNANWRFQFVQGIGETSYVRTRKEIFTYAFKGGVALSTV